MDGFRVLEIKESVWEDNDRKAACLREELRQKGVFLVNLMASPGAGKTTTLVGTVEALKSTLNIGIMEADIDSDVDARTIAGTGARVIQLHTGGMCHLDADMTRQGLEGLGLEGLDVVVLENIGNLVCPADFDTGAACNVMILSVPEGDDKPLKYPKMFSMVDVLLINKTDAIEFFGFSMEKLTERVRRLNPEAVILPVSAKTGDGMPQWTEWLKMRVDRFRKENENHMEEASW